MRRNCGEGELESSESAERMAIRAEELAVRICRKCLTEGEDETEMESKRAATEN